MMNDRRIYRNWIEDKGLASFTVTVGESDLFIRADKPLTSQAESYLRRLREVIEGYIQREPEFAAALAPYAVEETAPEIIREMSGASFLAGVGPMAAVAGAIAEYVGKELLRYSSEVIIENGGDIFMKTRQTRKVGIFAGASSFTGKLALEIAPAGHPWGICTSSGTVGPSLSFGRADAAVAVCHDAILADAWATRLGNMVKSAGDIEKTLQFVKTKSEIKGTVLIVGDKIGAYGEVKLTMLRKRGQAPFSIQETGVKKKVPVPFFFFRRS